MVGVKIFGVAVLGFEYSFERYIGLLVIITFGFVSVSIGILELRLKVRLQNIMLSIINIYVDFRKNVHT